MVHISLRRNGTRFGLLLFACIAQVGMRAAAEMPAALVPSPLFVSEGDRGDGLIKLDFDRDVYAQVKAAEKVRMTGFALDDRRTVELDLHRVTVFDKNATIVVGTDQGDVPMARPDVVLLSGSVVGEPDSFAFLGLSPHGTNAIIHQGEETFVVSSGARPAGGEAVIYEMGSEAARSIQWQPFQCGNDTLVGPPANLRIAAGGGGGAATARSAAEQVRVVRLALETDWEFTGSLFGGDTDASAAYAATLIGAVSEVYTRDVNVALAISYLRVWSTASDPWSGADTGEQLDEFRAYWNSNMSDVDRHLAHFLSGRPLGGGIAYVGVLCWTGWDYGVSANLGGHFPYPLQDNNWQNWDFMVTAHELGHNHGAPHTHDTTPKIDNCAGGDCSVTPNGTIMSYCHTCPGGMTNIVLRFHDRIIDEYMLPFISNRDFCGFGPSQAEPEGIDKNRYISFAPDNPGLSTAIQVTLASSMDFPDSVGASWWVDTPDADGAAGLSPTPVYRSWDEPMLHVGDCRIVPAASYEVRSIIEGSPESDPSSYSPVAVVDTSPRPVGRFWGDCVGPFTGSQWDPPDGEVTFGDVQAAIKTFQGDPTAPHFSSVDLSEEMPDGVVNFADVQWIIKGFIGQPYPYSDPALCP